jgi:dedicated sortase system histidine kinase
VSLRRQLLLVSLATLLLPWGGCQVIRHTEQLLRERQADALALTANAVANSLSGNAERIYPSPAHLSEDSWPAHDLYAVGLSGRVLIDGYATDWELDPMPAPWQRGTNGQHATVRYLLGVRDRYAYLYVATSSLSGDDAYRIEILAVTPQGLAYTLEFAGQAPGPVMPQLTTAATADVAASVSEQRVEAVVASTPQGFNLELRLPLDMLGPRLGFVVYGSDDTYTVGGSLQDAERQRPGLWFASIPELSAYLASFALEGIELQVVERRGWITASAEAVAPAATRPSRERWLAGRLPLRLYRLIIDEPPRAARLADPPGRVSGAAVTAALEGRSWVSRFVDENERALLIASAPILAGDAIVGAVLARENTDTVLTLADPAAARLLNLTLLATIVVAALLLAFATLLSSRVRRLRRAALSALDAQGRLHAQVPGTKARDELGDLARAYQDLLQQLDENARYLRTLGDKLAHELRTPLTVVSSSLDNLDATLLNDDSRTYLQRARSGVERLSALLAALREATRLEQSLSSAEQEDVDLDALVRGVGSTYADAFPDWSVHAETPGHPCRSRAAPELLSQMLDKLVENAVSFTPTGGRIVISLCDAGRHWSLAVANDGPRLKHGQAARLFDSLVSDRPTRGDAPHLGLGLYLVRLIAEFHGGEVAAGNSATLDGAEFTVRLPKSATG